MAYAVGSLVQARGREWVVLPSDDDEVLRLRPLGGSDEEAVGLYLPLEGGEVRQATLGPPDPSTVGDFASARLLRDAVRLSLRSGAGPLRCLARIAVEPRPYQLVPLLMALKLDPVRLLIGDDVGIGKTIEAALVARELLDRGEIRRLCVLCPPHLCEQWASELEGKFHLPAVVVRAGSVTSLERDLPLNRSLFEEYPYVVVSIDYIKSDRRRADFVRACPEFVIVDEGHTCARPAAQIGAQHQRHELVAELARDPNRHLVLTTATPHSGDERAFASLVAMLDPELGRRLEESGAELRGEDRQRLARHFVQRRRADIRHYLERDTAFPERISSEETYRLSPAYRHLLEEVLDYAGEVVATAQKMGQFQRRLRWWAALALLRCASSSPAAAAAALRTRLARPATENVAALDRMAQAAIFDEQAQDEAAQDDSTPGVDTAEGDDEGEGETSGERRRLRRLAKAAEALSGAGDPKLARAAELIERLLGEGYNPIVFCRYIATANYVAEELRGRLQGVEVRSVTGELPSEERAAQVEELGTFPKRVLVATDCLSEGINLQQYFDAVLHYDLSWNPTRHEQREGRVDRYGQASPKVRTVMFYGQDNRVDGAVLEVLLRKAERIRKALGVSVPLPTDTNSILEAIFDELFKRRQTPEQLAFAFLASTKGKEIEAKWQAVAEREKRTRTVFAQHALRPQEVAAELARATAAIGGADDVKAFLAEAAQRLGAPATPQKQWLELDLGPLPAAIRHRAGLAEVNNGKVRLAFELPVPPGVIYIARTHPLVEAVAGYLTDVALDDPAHSPARRCGAIRTRAVPGRTVLLLLRARYRIRERKDGAWQELLAEEALLAGFRGEFANPVWLADDEVNALADAVPSSNVPPGQASLWVKQAVDALPALDDDLRRLGRARAQALLAEHRRVRSAARLQGVQYQVEPHLPLDVLGVYVLMPEPMQDRLRTAAGEGAERRGW